MNEFYVLKGILKNKLGSFKDLKKKRKKRVKFMEKRNQVFLVSKWIPKRKK